MVRSTPLNYNPLPNRPGEFNNYLSNEGMALVTLLRFVSRKTSSRN
jgi:hypothetical protein